MKILDNINKEMKNLVMRETNGYDDKEERGWQLEMNE